MTETITFNITVTGLSNSFSYDQFEADTVDWGDGSEIESCGEYGSHQYELELDGNDDPIPQNFTVVFYSDSEYPFNFGDEGANIGIYDSVVNSIIISDNALNTISYLPSTPIVKFLGSTPISANDGVFEEAGVATIQVPQGSLSAYTSAGNYPNPNSCTYVEYTPTNNVPTVSQDLLNLYGHLRTLHKQWFYDKDELDEGFLRKSSTVGLLKNDGTVDTTTYLTASDISGKIDSIDLSSVATSGSYTDLTNVPSTFTPNTHGHGASEVSDNQAYDNIGTVANSTQDVINSAVDNTIGALLGVELISVVTTLPTATASTMDKLYFVPEANAETDDAYEIYVTVRTGVTPTYTYTWEKLDTARINLSGYSTINHVHGNIANTGTVGTNADYFVTTGTGGLATSQATIGNITTDGAIGSDTGKVAVTTTNGEVTVSDWYHELDSLVVDLINEGLENNNNNGE